MGNHVILFSFDYLGNHVVDRFWEVFWVVSIWLVYKEVFVTLRNTFILYEVMIGIQSCENGSFDFGKAFWFLNSFGVVYA